MCMGRHEGWLDRRRLLTELAQDQNVIKLTRQRRGGEAQRHQGAVVVGIDAAQVGGGARALLHELKAGALQGGLQADA